MGGQCVLGANSYDKILMRDLCEVVSSVVRNGPIGQSVQEAQHRHGVLVTGVLDLLVLTTDHRTLFGDSLWDTGSSR